MNRAIQSPEPHQVSSTYPIIEKFDYNGVLLKYNIENSEVTECIIKMGYNISEIDSTILKLKKVKAGNSGTFSSYAFEKVEGDLVVDENCFMNELEIAMSFISKRWVRIK